MAQDIFKDKNIIRLNWKNYDDNDMLYNNGQPLNVRITRPIYISHIDNTNTKSIIKGGLTNLTFTSPHFPSSDTTEFIACNAMGSVIANTIKSVCVCHKGAWLKHFRCKTITEYLDNKMPNLTMSGYHNIEFNDEFFFSLNKKTDEKVKIYEEYMSKYIKYDYTNLGIAETKYSILTCVFGEDKLKEINNPDKDVEYVCVTDNKSLVSETWKIIYVPADNNHPICNWKYPKFHPFEFVTNDICIYVDATIEINSNLNPIAYSFNSEYYTWMIK